GFVGDFLTVLESLAPALASQPKLKIVTNAGGMAPDVCARHAAAILTKAGLGTMRIAAVSGDDLLPRLDDLIADGELFANLDTGLPFGDVRPKIASANAYLGAGGIVAALGQGARIVI